MTMSTIYATAEEAIVASAEHDEITRCKASETNRLTLLAACDDSADGEEQEFWGSDNDGNSWRVHIRTILEPDRDIVYEGDPMLTVHIDRAHAEANVRYSYEGNDTSYEPTCYQTADMPWDDQAAAKMINDWLESQGG
jgi:hypothetical protein